MYLGASLGNSLVESLSLYRGNFRLKSSRLTRAVGASKGTRAPRAAAVNLAHVGQLSERLGVSQRDVDDSMVAQGGHGRKVGRLLPATQCTGRHEDTGVLSVEAARGPDATGSIPKCLYRGIIVLDMSNLGIDASIRDVHTPSTV